MWKLNLTVELKKGIWMYLIHVYFSLETSSNFTWHKENQARANLKWQEFFFGMQGTCVKIVRHICWLKTKSNWKASVKMVFLEQDHCMQWWSLLGHSPITFFSCSVPCPLLSAPAGPRPLFTHPHFASPSHIRSTCLLMHIQDLVRSMDIQMVK